MFLIQTFLNSTWLPKLRLRQLQQFGGKKMTKQNQYGWTKPRWLSSYVTSVRPRMMHKASFIGIIIQPVTLQTPLLNTLLTSMLRIAGLVFFMIAGRSGQRPGTQ